MRRSPVVRALIPGYAVADCPAVTRVDADQAVRNSQIKEAGLGGGVGIHLIVEVRPLIMIPRAHANLK